MRLAVLAAAAALLAGCQTDGPGPMAQAPAPAPMTRTRAASQCWMQTEKLATRMSLDRRADIVETCIDRKMHGEPG
jgi:hypothetical protein